MERKVEFKVGKDVLRGFLFIPKGKGPFPGVIFFHGSESKGETYFEAAKKLSKHGIIGFPFNLRGCGISDGDITDQTIGSGLEDVKEALEAFLNIDELDKDRVGLFGSSYGGFLAAAISLRYNFKSIFLHAPASYSPQDMIMKHGTPIVDSKDFIDSESYKEIARFKDPVLITQCELDDVLPEGMVEKYIKVTENNPRREVYILKGARHRVSINPRTRNVLIEKIIDWFSRTL